MAARLNPRHQDMVRTKIQGSHLIKLLQDHADGRIELSDARRDSAKFLIGYAIARPAPELPDVGKTGSVVVQIVRYSPDPA